MKKTYPFLLILLFFSIETAAQQDPYFTHYMFNKLVYNPAYAGAKDAICANLVYHNQWTSLTGPDDETAPVTQSFNIHSPLTILKDHKIGLGLDIYNDGHVFERSLSLMFAANYQYDLDIGTISGGFNAGLFQKSLDGEFRPITANDPLVPASGISDLVPDVGLGVYLRNEDYYVGLSALHLLQSKFQWTTIAGADYRLIRSFYLSGGYNFRTGGRLDIQPNILLKRQGSLQADINVNLLLDQRYWGGLNYRSSDAISLLLGMYINDNLRAGYSYDITTSELIQFAGTHEIFVNYCFKLKFVEVTEKRFDSRHL
ncbi:MAG: type IX secretion system membrane protein PorP/SprF [Bacteroidia bacterium]